MKSVFLILCFYSVSEGEKSNKSLPDSFGKGKIRYYHKEKEEGGKHLVFKGEYAYNGMEKKKGKRKKCIRAGRES